MTETWMLCVLIDLIDPTCWQEKDRAECIRNMDIQIDKGVDWFHRSGGKVPFLALCRRIENERDWEYLKAHELRSTEEIE